MQKQIPGFSVLRPVLSAPVLSFFLLLCAGAKAIDCVTADGGAAAMREELGKHSDK